MPDREIMSQEMSDQLFMEVEKELCAGGVTNPIAFNREFKRLCQIFNGTCIAYDKAYVAKDDIQLGKAIWRNLMNQEESLFDPDNEDVKMLVVYLKKQKMALKFCDEEKFAQGELPFMSLKETLVTRRTQ